MDSVPPWGGEGLEHPISISGNVQGHPCQHVRVWSHPCTDHMGRHWAQLGLSQPARRLEPTGPAHPGFSSLFSWCFPLPGLQFHLPHSHLWPPLPRGPCPRCPEPHCLCLALSALCWGQPVWASSVSRGQRVGRAVWAQAPGLWTLPPHLLMEGPRKDQRPCGEGPENLWLPQKWNNGPVGHLLGHSTGPSHPRPGTASRPPWTPLLLPRGSLRRHSPLDSPCGTQWPRAVNQWGQPRRLSTPWGSQAEPAVSGAVPRVWEPFKEVSAVCHPL